MHPGILFFILGAFATFRLAELLCCEDGPYDILKRFRELFSKHSQTYEMLNCFYCSSVWAAAFFTLLGFIGRIIPLMAVPLWLFGLSGGAVAILRVVRPKK